jgi:hypothetical protein
MGPDKAEDAGPPGPTRGVLQDNLASTNVDWRTSLTIFPSSLYLV